MWGYLRVPREGRLIRYRCELYAVAASYTSSKNSMTSTLPDSYFVRVLVLLYYIINSVDSTVDTADWLRPCGDSASMTAVPA